MEALLTGEAVLFFDYADGGLLSQFMDRWSLSLTRGQNEVSPLSALLEGQLYEYFEGRRKAFDLPLQFYGTPFQKAAWNALQNISYGSTCTYREQASQLGNAKSYRAVARANAMNTLAILVPCHRVIATNGSLTGYTGGLERKKWLLKHEQKDSSRLSHPTLFAS